MNLTINTREMMILVANVAIVWGVARGVPRFGWAGDFALCMVIALSPVIFAAMIRAFDHPYDRAVKLSRASGSLLVFFFPCSWLWLYYKRSDLTLQIALAQIHVVILTSCVLAFVIWIFWLRQALCQLQNQLRTRRSPSQIA